MLIIFNNETISFVLVLKLSWIMNEYNVKEEHEVNWKKQTKIQKFKNNAMSLVHKVLQFFNRMAQESRGNKLEDEQRKDLKMKRNKKKWEFIQLMLRGTIELNDNEWDENGLKWKSWTEISLDEQK